MDKLIQKSVQCSAIKRNGERCEMRTKHPDGRCHLHRERTLAQKRASRENGAKLSNIFKTIDGLNQRCAVCPLRTFLITEDGDKRICPYYTEDGVCLIDRGEVNLNLIDYSRIENVQGLINALMADQLKRYGFERIQEIIEGSGIKTSTDSQLMNIIKLLERLEKLKSIKISKEVSLEMDTNAWDKIFGE